MLISKIKILTVLCRQGCKLKQQISLSKHSVGHLYVSLHLPIGTLQTA